MGTQIERRQRDILIRDLPRALAKKLDKATSYYVEGFFFAPSFRARRWDGKEHLLKKRIDGSYILPSGLIRCLIGLLEDSGSRYVITDLRAESAKHAMPLWKGPMLRPYQEDAVQAFTETDGPGILKMAIRSGKTVTAASIIHKLGVTTLFVVPSTLLLHQTAKELKDCLGLPVGVLGDDVWKPESIVNVATIQTLVSMRKSGSALYKKLASNTDLLIVDEIHHAAADTWRTIALDIQSYWVLGLTATPPLRVTNKGVTKGGIWLTAIAGDVVYETNIKDLIDGGWLVRPLIEFHKITSPDLAGLPWSANLRREGILFNPARNGIIAQRSISKAKEGSRVLVVCALTEHVDELSRVFGKHGAYPPTVTGKMETGRRHDVIKRFVAGETPIIITTVMGEGVNIPEVDVMVNAAGGKSEISTIQRMRNLTKYGGKDSALIVDFLDFHNGYFADHSMERMRTYRGEGAFEFKVIE